MKRKNEVGGRGMHCVTALTDIDETEQPNKQQNKQAAAINTKETDADNQTVTNVDHFT